MLLYVFVVGGIRVGGICCWRRLLPWLVWHFWTRRRRRSCGGRDELEMTDSRTLLFRCSFQIYHNCAVPCSDDDEMLNNEI